MPTYEYACRSCGHAFEVVQKMTDDPMRVCPECGGELRKVFAPPAITFKGSGFYATDHGKRASGVDAKKSEKAGGDSKKAEKAGASSGGSSSGSESGSSSGSGSGSGSSSSSGSGSGSATKAPAKESSGS